ncbi:MAG: hypothetical protein PWP03_47 [Candidatus Woesearchaeota archaeon]|nr:hypothetical protein [Candidatus Woesearchaeota archaeon]MDN5327409.1 hypothetical protein [Candidatus Woesearchaeota archaeon]
MSKYSGKLFCSLSPEDIDNLYKIFKPEVDSGFNNRAGFEVLKEKNTLAINFHAQDITALKAVMNSFLKVLTIYEGTKEMLKNESNTTDDLSSGTNSTKPSPSETND